MNAPSAGDSTLVKTLTSFKSPPNEKVGKKQEKSLKKPTKQAAPGVATW